MDYFCKKLLWNYPVKKCEFLTVNSIMLISFNVYFEFNKLQVGVGVTLNEQLKILGFIKHWCYFFHIQLVLDKP